jgi:Zn-dependent protease with chaperone function
VIAYGALVLSVVLLGQGVGPLLGRQRWAPHHPAAAITLWLGALSGAVAAAVGLVALVVFGSPGPGHGVVEWFARCVTAHAHTGAAPAVALSLVCLAGAAVMIRTITVRLRKTLAVRRRHRQVLGLLVSTRQDLDDVCVLDHPIPVAYCMPARDRPIVLSSGALDRLDPAQLAAVLDHERAHLKGRHHLILSIVDAVGSTIPSAATFRHAREALPRLLEHVADDAAAARHGRAAVAGALRNLAVMPYPPGSLAAAPSGTEALEQRLARLEGARSATRGRRLAWTGAALSAAMPFAIVAGWITAITFTC